MLPRLRGEEAMVILRMLVACVLVLSLRAANVHAEPENGWWWNPHENGRGFFIEMTGGVIYVGGYFYADDGRATWLTSGGPLKDPMHYEGTLQAYAGGQTLFGPYHPPQAGIDVGPITLDFTDDLHGTITWPGGTIPIERQIFGTGVPAFQPEPGWWWNASESGRGYSVEVQGSNLFLVGFMYDDAGKPLWYFSAGPMTTPTHFDGDILQFADGQTLTGPFKPPGTPRKVGRLSADFSDAQNGQLVFSNTGQKTAPPPGAPSITRQFGLTELVGTEHWPRWRGGLQRVETQTVATVTQTIGYFYHAAFDGPGPASSGASKTYTLAEGSNVEIELLGHDDASGCDWEGKKTFPVPEGTLTIDTHLRYDGRLGATAAPMVFIPFTLTCPNGVGQSQYQARILDPFGSVHGGVASVIRTFFPYQQWQQRTDRPVIAGRRATTPAPNTVGFEAWRFEAAHCTYVAGTTIPTFCEGGI
jgi:hypothetical protein